MGGNVYDLGVIRRTILSASSNDNIDPKADDCPHRFQGQWSDEETGLCYNFQRHYDPFSGQYTTSDPIGLAGGSRPHSYSNTPNVQIDPLGLRVKTPKEIGDEGKNAVRAKYNIGNKTKITINGITRFPDGLSSTTITEIKNIQSQSLTAQIRDDIDYATQNRLQFDLYVNQNTYLTGPLQNAISSGQINIKYIP